MAMEPIVTFKAIPTGIIASAILGMSAQRVTSVSIEHPNAVYGASKGQILWDCAKEFSQIPSIKEFEIFSKAIRSCQESAEKTDLGPMPPSRLLRKPVDEYVATTKTPRGQIMNGNQEKLQRLFHAAAQSSIYVLVGMCYLSALSSFGFFA